MREFEYVTVSLGSKTPNFHANCTTSYFTKLVIPDDHKEHIGEDMAEEYFDHSDGWEDDWPIDFVVWEMVEEKPVFFCRMTIEIEMSPTFSATLKQ